MDEIDSKHIFISNFKKLSGLKEKGIWNYFMKCAKQIGNLFGIIKLYLVLQHRNIYIETEVDEKIILFIDK